MVWKEALEINDPRWKGIGKHIATITEKAIKEQGKSAIDLTNHLRFVGNRYIEVDYVNEYLSGNASFGCFFPQFRDFLGISSGDVFRNVNEREAQGYLKSLDEYLTNVHNEESFIIFLEYQPGKELREYVRDFLASRLTERLKRDPQDITKPEKLDRIIAGNEYSLEFGGKRDNMGIEAWREAYTHGTFTNVTNTQHISNLCSALGFGIDRLVPTREPSNAERYEVHQRWAWSGGICIPGQHVKGPEEAERQIRNRPDPIGRSEHETNMYRITSNLTIMLGLFRKLPELVQDRLQ